MSLSCKKPSCGSPFSSNSENTSPDNSGCRLLSNPCVAKCTIRNRLNSELLAVALLALKSSAPQELPGGLDERIDFASCRVKGSRRNCFWLSSISISSAELVTSPKDLKARSAPVADEP